jgi:hypothetical protein
VLSSLTGKFAIQAAYGYDARDEDDDMIALSNLVVEELSASANPGTYLVDTLPWCK